MRCTCGLDNAADARFCGKCGKPLDGANAQAAEPRTPAPAAVPPAPRPALKLPRLSRSTIIVLVAIALVGTPGYWWMNRPLDRYELDASGPFPIRIGAKAGYIDRGGKIVIEPQFDDAARFSEGFAAIRIGDKVGYIDESGKVTITPQFDGTSSDGNPIALHSYAFRYGRARVLLGGRYGFIDDDGKYVRNPDLVWASPYSAKYAAVRTETNTPVFLDTSGKSAVTGAFEAIWDFTSGLAPAAASNQWGYIDRSGKFSIDPQFQAAGNFAEGLAAVVAGGRVGYIDRGGKFAINPQFDVLDVFDDVNAFHDGRARIVKEGKFGFVDAEGQLAIAATYVDALAFSEGLAAVRTTEGWGFIDRTGKTVIPPKFDAAESFLGEVALVAIGGIKAYIDRSGNYIGDPFKGHAIRPAQAVQEVWEGDVVAPSWKAHERFVLIREGTKISGFYYTEQRDQSSMADYSEVTGDVAADDTFRLASENGFLWKGRFTAPVVMTGVRPNGPEGTSPEFPFRFAFVRAASPADLPPPMPPTTPDWAVFYERFKTAVAARDMAAVMGTMDHRFSLQNGRARDMNDLMSQISWSAVDKAIAEGQLTEGRMPSGRGSRGLLDAQPCAGCVYQVHLSFAQDATGHWRWTGMSFPGD